MKDYAAAPLSLYNTLSRQKEVFTPIAPPFVGLYVCGPTVYGHAHLGHARPYISFDVLRRLLEWKGLKVRYVRNITDVGHLVADADSGEDKIGKEAKLHQLEPMEVVQTYTSSFREDMAALGLRIPSIEPLASGHIIEQIQLVQQILDAGLAYESNGSVYFDAEKFAAQGKFGRLSGRQFEEGLTGTRNLDGQDEKRNPQDFALWKAASPEHIMRWPSPWGEGFPGWHLECSVMSAKYLGKTFDIHGGGMDLMFPHHECEIAQHQAAHDTDPARYWMHVNMLTINGQKMGKSLGNNISLKEFFSGNHPLLAQAYSPMTIRYFILQAHYRSTLDFSNDALLAAHKGLMRLVNGLKTAHQLQYPVGDYTANSKIEKEIEEAITGAFEALHDDLNTAQVIAHLFTLLKRINAFSAAPAQILSISERLFQNMIAAYSLLFTDILGLVSPSSPEYKPLLDGLLGIYAEAKAEKAYDKVDAIRQVCKAAGLAIKDTKTGIDWAWEE